MRFSVVLAFVCASVASPMVASNASPEALVGSETAPDPPGITWNAFGRSCHISLTGAGECHPIHQDGTYDLGHVVNLPNNNKGKPGSMTTIYVQQAPQPTPQPGWGQSPPPNNGWPGEQQNNGRPRQGNGGW